MKILSFCFNNAWSFKADQCLDFAFKSVDAKYREDSRFIQIDNDYYVPSVVTCIGANASGKSNLMTALISVLFFITNRDTDLDVSPFILCKDVTPISDFELLFELKNIIFRFSLSYNHEVDRVEFEELFELNAETGRWNYFYKRWLDDNGGIAITKSPKSKFNIDKMKRELEHSESLLAVSRDLKHETGLKHILNGLQNFYVYKYNVASPVEEVVRMFKDIDVIDKVSDYLKAFDVGIARIEHSEVDLDHDFLEFEPVKKIIDLVESMPAGTISHSNIYKKLIQGKAQICEAVHEVDGVEYKFNINNESDGTKQLIKILFPIIAALSSGGVAIIDEIEVGLHPIVVEGIIELFREQTGDKVRGQLICNSHSVNVINQLSKRQIVLVEKDRSSLESQAWFLHDVRDVKERDNFFMNYITGKYGAVPQVS